MDPSIDDFAPDLGDAQLVSGMRRERLVAAVGTLVIAIAAVGAVLASDELEVSFFMVAAVIAGLVCFDRSMRPSLGSFGPWLLVSLAPISKTIPTVWYELTKESGARFERYDHVGSLLFGACLLGAGADSGSAI